MYKLSVKNAAGDTLHLSQNKNYAVTGIEGLTPVAATINTSNAGMLDGAVYNSARLSYRNIVITASIVQDVESARIKLYDYFQTKQFCKLFFENDSRNVYIDGYVETFECDLFALGETVQISIICPDPYFKDTRTKTDTGSTVVSLFEFPTEFNNVEFSRLISDAAITVSNNGDISAGFDIEIHFIGNVKNPVLYSATTGGYFGLNSQFVAGDRVVINTRNGKKSVKLIRFGVEINQFNNIQSGSTWLQLTRGVNTFTFNADSGVNNMQISITHTDLYAGV